MKALTFRHTLAPLVAVLAIGVSAPSSASEAIVKKARCVACHAVDAKRVGPAYKEVAAKYAGQKDAVAQLAERIQKGSVPGKGNWGAIPMPANPQVNADEAKQLATWVLSVK